jgi:hypothetical protein
LYDRAILSVGLTLDFADREDRNKVISWLAIQSSVDENAMNALLHINELEALIAIEKYSSLSRMADDLRNDLAATRDENNSLRNQGYQEAINRIMLKIEDIDLDTQAATSIAEMQAAMLLKAAELLPGHEDFQAIVNLAKSVHDGCV